MVNNNNKNNDKYQKLNTYAVFPDYWKRSWGEPPLLGYVKETSEYWAKYQAYDRKLLPYNSTFGPKCVIVRETGKPIPAGLSYGTGPKQHYKKRDNSK